MTPWLSVAPRQGVPDRFPHLPLHSVLVFGTLAAMAAFGATTGLIMLEDPTFDL
jgi:hypothetical protein